ncbi:hypothetical protein CSPX01_08891 [Colletotrichum filicis]|nr:hypothetical protein CSPX01_08891 [Colletotrichum filicis]
MDPSLGMDLQTMDRLLAECQSTVQGKYLCHNDSENSLQWMIATSARIFFVNLPLLIYEPVLSHTSRPFLPQEIRHRLVSASNEMILCSHDLETRRAVHRRGRWFCTYLHWYAVTLLLENLADDLGCAEDSQQLWTAIEVAQTYLGSTSMDRGSSRLWQSLAMDVARAQEKRGSQNLHPSMQSKTSHMELAMQPTLAAQLSSEQDLERWSGTELLPMNTSPRVNRPVSVDVGTTAFTNQGTDDWLDDILWTEL